MPTPASGSPSRLVSPADSSTQNYELINPLLAPSAWGSSLTLASGGVFSLSYSFPWQSGFTTDTFAPDYGSGEHLATTRSGFDAAQQEAFELALQSIANVANITFTKVAETSTNVGVIRIAFSSAVTAGDDATDTLAYASYPNEFDPAGGDIWVNPGLSAGIWTPNSMNFGTLVHELGHAIGLQHPNDDPRTSSHLYTIMTYVEAPNNVWLYNIVEGESFEERVIEPEGPQLHDILALQYLYGVNTSYNSGNNTYTFDPGTPFFRTLWDAGGADTISASNFAKPVVIDLNAGSFSSLTILSPTTELFDAASSEKKLYDGSNNLAIAYGVVIENAVGGAGNDRLVGNAADNRLEGQAGNDTIEGGAGSDTVVWSSASQQFDVSYSDGSWVITDRSGSLGADTVRTTETLQFTDRSVITQSETHASYADLPPELYQFFIVAFNAAPGVTYMNQLAEAYRYGLSVKEIVDIYVTKSQFTDLYATTLSDRELSVLLVENIVKSSAPSSVKSGAVEDLVAAMGIGYSRSDILYTVFGNLAKKPFTDATWGNTAKFFVNQIAVAKAFTETMDQSTTDLSTLRAALAAVTKDSVVTTDAQAIEVVIDGLFGVTGASSAQAPVAYATQPDPEGDAEIGSGIEVVGVAALLEWHHGLV